MIRLPSIQRDYDWYWSGDPALVQPPVALAVDASDEDKAAHKIASDEYKAKLKACRDTGDWSPLLKPGEQPLKFVLCQVDRNAWRALDDRRSLPSASSSHVSSGLLLALLARLAIKDIVGAEGVRVVRSPDSKFDDWTMAQAELVTLLDTANENIISELGLCVFMRLNEAGPFGRK
jgi:hypothetical protein